MSFLLVQNYFLSNFRVLLEQSIVENYFLSEISILRSLKNRFKQGCQNLFHFGSPLEEQLCTRSHQMRLKLGLVSLLLLFNDLFKNVWSLFNLVTKFTKDPDV